jgi:hypothetical protein
LACRYRSPIELEGIEIDDFSENVWAMRSAKSLFPDAVGPTIATKGLSTPAIVTCAERLSQRPDILRV